MPPPPLLQNNNIFYSPKRKRILDLLHHIPAFTIRFLRLLLFVIVLLPAFVVFVWHYVTCDREAVYYCDGCSCGTACNNSDNKDDTKLKKKHGKNNHATNPVSIKCQKCRTPYFSRHYLDIYGSRTPLPRNASCISSGNNNSNSNCNSVNKKPVVIFLTGGAWTIGYRMWGTLLGRALAPFGILVIVPDYRNFPSADISHMVKDVDESISWVFNHVEDYGGDRDNVVLVGQSAGAHIGGVVVARKVLDWLCEEKKKLGWKVCHDGNFHVKSMMNLPPLLSPYRPNQIRGFISTSAPHNLVTMREVFQGHGLSSSAQRSIFGGKEYNEKNTRCEDADILERWSPFHLVEKCQNEYKELVELISLKNNKTVTGAIGIDIDAIFSSKHDDNVNTPCNVLLKDFFPKMCIIHGTSDKTVSLCFAVSVNTTYVMI